MSKKGKVGTSGREISAALYPKGRPETEEYKERLAAFERRQRENRKPQGIEAKRARWNRRAS